MIDWRALGEENPEMAGLAEEDEDEVSASDSEGSGGGGGSGGAGDPGGPDDEDPEDLIARAFDGDDLLEGQARIVAEYVAGRGFDPRPIARPRQRVREYLESVGRPVGPDERFTQLTVHYIRHVLAGKEWPEGTTEDGYEQTIRDLISDPDTGIVLGRFRGHRQLTFFRRSNELLGPDGNDFVLVEYRVKLKHWMTAFQPKSGFSHLDDERRTELRWLRRPK